MKSRRRMWSCYSAMLSILLLCELLLIPVIQAQQSAVHQLFFVNAGSGSGSKGVWDSLVLLNLTDIGCYSRIQIYRNHFKIFEFYDSTLNIAGKDNVVAKSDESWTSPIYVFTLDDPPGPPHYMGICADSGHCKNFGLSPNSTGDFIADIDGDGYLEIGGLPWYNEAGAPSLPYVVFKVKPGYPSDRDLSKAIEGVIRKRQHRQK